jgi:Sulfotransferase domain
VEPTLQPVRVHKMGYIKQTINLLRMARIGYSANRSSDDQRLFEVEMDLINGSHRNDNTHPSIIHFSFNKAATQYVKSILTKCALANGIVPVALHDYAFNSNFPFLDHLSASEIQKYIHVFRKTGYIYTVFGGMVEEIPDIDQYKILLAVRDPRDILVSSYYSQAYSHGEPSKSGDKYAYFMRSRNTARNSNIDQYVLAESNDICARYNKYNELLLEAGIQVHVVKYENMVYDFRSWLEEIIDYCELELENDLIESLITENNRIKPRGEDIYEHLRRGVPGDYKEKLHPETIAELDNRLYLMMKRFGYN